MASCARQLLREKVRLCLMLLCLTSFLLMVTAIATDSWSYKLSGENRGLWNVCESGRCKTIQWKQTDRKLFLPKDNITVHQRRELYFLFL